MFDVSTPYLSPVVRRITVSVLPIIPNLQGQKICGFSVNFLRFPRFFGSGVRLEHRGYSFLGIAIRLGGIGIEPNTLSPVHPELVEGFPFSETLKRAGRASTATRREPAQTGLG
jgi:hypothetical protein